MEHSLSISNYNSTVRHRTPDRKVLAMYIENFYVFTILTIFVGYGVQICLFFCPFKILNILSN